MDYNDLMIIAKKKDILQKDLCESLKLTPSGFKRGVEKGTIQKNKIQVLCQQLEITPNEFFGWPHQEEVSGNGNYASHISGVNTQNSNEAIKALNNQLKEKDKQIDRLMTIIEKNKLK